MNGLKFWFVLWLPLVLALGCQDANQGQQQASTVKTPPTAAANAKADPKSNEEISAGGQATPSTTAENKSNQEGAGRENEVATSGSADTGGAQVNSDSTAGSGVGSGAAAGVDQDAIRHPALNASDKDVATDDSWATPKLDPELAQKYAEASKNPDAANASPLPPVDPKWIRMDPNYEIWLDMQQNRVVVGGRICLTQGPLEMFACPTRSKEHESVVALVVKSRLVHAGLLAIGLEPGHPVIWRENDFTPPTGPEVDISVSWMEGEAVVVRRAQEMVLKNKTQQVMDESWVFAGSRFVVDEESGESIYLGDNGDLVCVSNFSSATLDIPIRSEDGNDNLTYIANTEKIPPLDTRVLLYFSAKGKPQDEGDTQPQTETPKTEIK